MLLSFENAETLRSDHLKERHISPDLAFSYDLRHWPTKLTYRFVHAFYHTYFRGKFLLGLAADHTSYVQHVWSMEYGHQQVLFPCLVVEVLASTINMTQDLVLPRRQLTDTRENSVPDMFLLGNSILFL